MQVTNVHILGVLFSEIVAVVLVIMLYHALKKVNCEIIKEGENMGTTNPWENDSSLYEIFTSYLGEIVDDYDEISYRVKLIGPIGECIDCRMKKDKFKRIPYDVTVKNWFWLVNYVQKSEPQTLLTSVWPVAEYWHESWQKNKEGGDES